MKVIKRDDSIQEFSFDKVEKVVNKAFNSVNQEVPEKFIEQLRERLEKVKDDKIDVEDIQDIIQNELIKRNKYEVVESFINYRRKHAEARENKSDLIKQIREKLTASNVQNQNANVDEASFGGRVGEATSVVCKNEALKMMSSMARKNHENNIIYIHDLDSFCDGRTNCLTIPGDKALAIGFHTRQTDVRPAGSVSTASQLLAVVMQCQSLEQFGGVAYSHVDWSMVPYIRMSFKKHFRKCLETEFNWDKPKAKAYVNKCWENKGKIKRELPNDDKINYLQEMLDMTLSIDEKEAYMPKKKSKNPFKNFNRKRRFEKVYKKALEFTEEEIYQAVEGLFHNLNTLQSRSGNQLPFSSINYGTCTLTEGRMFTKACLDMTIRGLGKNGVTSIFPCQIFQYMKGVNDVKGTPNYDLKRLALESSTKRIYPNYANVDWSTNAGYDVNDPRTYVSTMGCRTYNGADINKLDYQNPQLKDGRGNLAPVTIILPTIAMMAKEKAEKNDKPVVIEFMKLLDKKIGEARDMLLERFNHMASQSSDSAKFMYENGMMFGYKPEEGIISALKHGTLAIGQLGLAETLQLLIGCDHTTEEGMELAKEIEALFNKRCKEFKEEYKLNFGVYLTPAESLCRTALVKFQKKYGIIHNVSDREYFTNSIHVPVWVDVDPFEKMEIESKLAKYSNAGCITYIEIPSNCYNNINAMETILDYSMKDLDLPYVAFNIPIHECEKCGERIWDINIECCPKCGHDKFRTLGRVTGYLSTKVEHFNKGKLKEFLDRVKHIKH